jgi:hypothetical protein
MVKLPVPKGVGRNVGTLIGVLKEVEVVTHVIGIQFELTVGQSRLTGNSAVVDGRFLV